MGNAKTNAQNIKSTSAGQPTEQQFPTILRHVIDLERGHGEAAIRGLPTKTRIDFLRTFPVAMVFRA